MPESNQEAGLMLKAWKHISVIWAAATHVDRVNCKRFFEQLDDYLDRALTPEQQARLEEHMAMCHRCLHLYRFESKVINELRAKMQRLEAPSALKDKILRQIQVIPEDVVESAEPVS